MPTVNNANRTVVPKGRPVSNGVKIPVLISSRRIQAKVKQLARQISKDYRTGRPPAPPRRGEQGDPRGRPPLMICVLNGAFVFMADLLRHLTIPVEYDFIRLSSYGQAAKSSGRIKVIMDIESQVSAKGGSASGGKGRDIIIVDDIIDTGLTARFLVNRFKQAQARSVRICALLDKPAGHAEGLQRRLAVASRSASGVDRPANRDKPARRIAQIKIDYPGFKIPNKFVVGYGLDYKDRYRQLKYIGYIPPHPSLSPSPFSSPRWGEEG